jgi:hypothetical protein
MGWTRRTATTTTARPLRRPLRERLQHALPEPQGLLFEDVRPGRNQGARLALREVVGFADVDQDGWLDLVRERPSTPT